MRSPTLQTFAAYLTDLGYRQTTIAVVISNLRQITPDGDNYPPTSQALVQRIQGHPSELRQAAIRNAWRMFAAFQAERGITVPELRHERPGAALRRERGAVHVVLPPVLQALRVKLLAPETRVSPTRLATWTWGMFVHSNDPAHFVLAPPRETTKDIGQFFLPRAEVQAAIAAWTALWGREPTQADYLFSVPPSGDTASTADGTA